MTFWAIFLGLILFFSGFTFHVIWWRIARPHDDIRALILSFLVGPAVLAGLQFFFMPGYGSLRETIAAVLVTVAIGAFYIMWYPAAQAASPTMLLVLQVAGAAKDGGATRTALRAAFDDELLCRQSISNLVHEHFAEEREGKLFVAARGAFLLRMLNTWRGLLGLKYGSG